MDFVLYSVGVVYGTYLSANIETSFHLIIICDIFGVLLSSGIEKLAFVRW